MGFPARFTSVSAGSGNVNGVTAGNSVTGTALSTVGIAAGTLSCLFVLLAETNTLTLTASFQVSNDNSTWIDLAGDAQNPANVAQSTGTAGADTAVSRAIPVPTPALGWKYIRPKVTVGVATGAAADTYALTWQYRKYNGFA